jgi:MFS family permease
VGVFVMFTAAGFVFATWASRLVAIRLTLGLDAQSMGLLLLCWSFGSITAMPLSSLLIQRFGLRRVLLAAASLAAMGLIGAGGATPAQAVAGVGVGLAALGIGFGVWDVTQNVAASDVERALRRAVMSRLHAGYSVGTIIAGATGAAMARLGVPVIAHFSAVAVLALAAVAWGAHTLLPAPQHDADRSARARGERSAWLESRTLLIGLVVLGLTLAEGAASDWMASGIEQSFGTSEATAIVGFTVFLTAQTAIRMFATPLVDRFGRPWAIRASGVAAAAGVGLYSLTPALPLVFVGAALWGAGAALVFPLGMSAAGDDPTRAAQRTAVVSTIGYGAFLSGPPLLGLLAQHVGFRLAMLALAAPTVLAVVLAGSTRPPGDKGGPDQGACH